MSEYARDPRPHGEIIHERTIAPPQPKPSERLIYRRQSLEQDDGTKPDVDVPDLEQPGWTVGIPESGALSEIQSEAARTHGEMAIQNGFTEDDFQIFLANIVGVGIGEGVLSDPVRVEALNEAIATIRAMGYAACEQDLKKLEHDAEDDIVQTQHAPNWGTMAGYITGDPASLRARGHTDSEIAGIIESLEANINRPDNLDQ